MKLRAPLYAQICAWFLLNLLLIALLVYGFVHAQFHLGLDSLIAGRAGDRIEAVTGVIVEELRDAPRESWSEILERFSANYGVRFSLWRENGDQVAGDAMTLPAEVRAEFNGLGRHEGRGGPPPAARRHPHEGSDEGLPGGPRPEPPEDRRRELREERRREAPPPFAPGNHPKKLMRTSDPARYWMLLRAPIFPPEHGPQPPLVLVAVSDSFSGGGLFFEWKPWVAVALGCLAVSVLCWLPLARGITVAIRRLTDVTGRIAEGRFDARAPETRGDELGSLAGSVNRMASRLEGFVSGQKRFLGDIAHELCAPIARLQMALGVLEQRAGGETQESVADLREEVEQMSALVGELLSFSKASLAGSTINRRATPLGPLAEQAVAREATPGAEFKVDIPEGAAILADGDLLLRALSNLLRNAARYAGEAGPITVSASREDEDWALSVRDQGPGIPAEALAKIFDPFYRVDASRDRATGGVGLGLAIVKTCVEACGGKVAARRLEPTGFEVTMTLPRAAAF